MMRGLVISAAGAGLDLADEIVAVPRLALHQQQQDEAQLAGLEHAASSAAPATFSIVPAMAAGAASAELFVPAPAHGVHPKLILAIAPRATISVMSHIFSSLSVCY